MRLKSILRGLTSLTLFVIFGVGALVISPLMLILQRPEWCQRVVRFAWRSILSLFVATRLIKVEHGDLSAIVGSVLVANHPSLIDVVILVSLIPKTLYVTKPSLRFNPFLSAIVRKSALPCDETLPEKAAPYLAKGWNVLIFPEGTRSPENGGLHALHRGAAQLALRTGAPIACVKMNVSRRILGKYQHAWDMGSETVTYNLTSSILPVKKAELAGIRTLAIDLTNQIRSHLS